MTSRIAKRTDGRAVGIECNGCQRMFARSFPYDQHRHSRFLQGTACCAFSDENRTTVTATQRPNMSTAALERRKGQPMRSTMLHILHIEHILQIFKNAKIQISQRVLPLQ